MSIGGEGEGGGASDLSRQRGAGAGRRRHAAGEGREDALVSERMILRGRGRGRWWAESRAAAGGGYGLWRLVGWVEGNPSPLIPNWTLNIDVLHREEVTIYILK